MGPVSVTQALSVAICTQSQIARALAETDLTLSSSQTTKTLVPNPSTAASPSPPASPRPCPLVALSASHSLVLAVVPSWLCRHRPIHYSRCRCRPILARQGGNGNGDDFNDSRV
ncbi:hypothetical protein PIB30_045260 [Stylosanthes scabra]|uniref:Uncharacterized protein n=1 Tax=Stylosanthes scabra TaxID=79078 RepID=A0ABU6ZEW5_9FABA|nr:hypothetical protein [Stylosanthes scabra]